MRALLSRLRDYALLLYIRHRVRASLSEGEREAEAQRRKVRRNG